MTIGFRFSMLTNSILLNRFDIRFVLSSPRMPSAESVTRYSITQILSSTIINNMNLITVKHEINVNNNIVSVF